ncbi:hypothetical protein BDW71DRAFT_203673 [Aspergillus fruticulosus]
MLPRSVGSSRVFDGGLEEIRLWQGAASSSMMGTVLRVLMRMIRMTRHIPFDLISMRKHLMLINIAIAPNNTDSELEREAWEWAGEVRDLWNERQPGREVHAYVNYVNGFESVEEKYGHEAWRLERLRALKEIYGPDNRFRCYNPVVQG